MRGVRADARIGLRRLASTYARLRYALLFYSLLLTLTAGPLLGALGLDRDVLELFLVLNLLAAVLGVGDRSRWRALRALLAIGVGTRVLGAWLHAPLLATAILPLWTAIALLAAAAALRFAMRATSVDREHLYAALSAYLLAGIFFGVLYQVLDQTWPGSFATAAGISDGSLSLSSTIYFSFVTLATLGYGDVVPRSEAARGLAILETVAGQLYLAVLVARLVSLYASQAMGTRRS